MSNVERPQVTIVAEDPTVLQRVRALVEAAGIQVAVVEAATASPFETRTVVPLAELEQQAIEHALRATGGRVAKAARLLGIGRATLYRRLAARPVTAAVVPSAPPEPHASSFH